MSTGTLRSAEVATTSSNSITEVGKSSPRPPLASLTPPLTRPKSVSWCITPAITSRGTKRSRYSLLNSGSISASRKRLNASTAICCSSVLNICPMRSSPSGFRKYVDGDHGFFDADQAAAVFLHGDLRVLHLALLRLAAQLRDKLVDLAQTGCADR